MITFLFSILIFILIFIVISFGIDRFLASPPYRGEISDHFDGKVFYSLGSREKKKTSGINERSSLFKWMMNRPKNKWVYQKNPSYPVLEKKIEGQEIVATYINHSTMLFQTEGLNIITDPVWAKRVSPFYLIGPKRFRDPGIKIEDLPPIDVILLSHNHYDHMDLQALRTLYKKYNPKIFTSLGNCLYLKSQGIKGAIDMDWWGRKSITPHVSVVSVPCQHFSARALSDRNTTLWSGFVLEVPRGPIYFAGDTGYGPFVSKIKEKYNKFILSFIPIGAFKPDWMMRAVHISPVEAFQIHQELNSERSIAIHFGTFKLADDKQDEAPELLLKTVADSKVGNNDFRVLSNGGSIKF